MTRAFYLFVVAINSIVLSTALPLIVRFREGGPEMVKAHVGKPSQLEPHALTQNTQKEIIILMNNMGRPKRSFLATADETLSPPASLSDGQMIARIVTAAGNNLYSVELPCRTRMLVEMPSRFRSQIWVKRGSYVVIDAQALANRNNKLGGEIINIVRDEKHWRKQSYWPKEFVQETSYPDDWDEEQSTMGKMPPEDSDDNS